MELQSGTVSWKTSAISILEVVVAIAVISIFSAVGIPTIASFYDEARHRDNAETLTVTAQLASRNGMPVYHMACGKERTIDQIVSLLCEHEAAVADLNHQDRIDAAKHLVLEQGQLEVRSLLR